MKIVIATGIYPPELGGPAEYAKNLADIWIEDGYKVDVKVFSKFNKFPSGIRHLIYLFYILPSVFKADFILALDTISCALPAVLASKLFGKKIILRTGGDFLWESYVERTDDRVLMRNFYTTRMDHLSLKDKITFLVIRFVLRNVDTIIWSTEWQRDIFMKPYGLVKQKHSVVENYYGPKLISYEPIKKNFIAATRLLKWKNLELMKKVFNRKDVINVEAVLDMEPSPHKEFLDKIARSYSMIIVSLGDISPNTILDAIRCQKPFIVTKEIGLYDRIKDIALFVDPQDEDDIAEKVLWLCDHKNYELQKKKVEAFTFVHSWEEIADEYINIFSKN